MEQPRVDYETAQRLFSSRKFSEALKILDFLISSSSLEVEPKARVHNLRGLIYEEDCRWDDARTEYNKAIDLQPNFAIAYYNRGYLLEDRYQLYEDALRDYTKAIELNPSHNKSFHNRAILLRNHFGKWQEALEDINRAIAISPDNANHHTNKGILLLYHFKQYEEALQEFNISDNPSLKSLTYTFMGELQDSAYWLDRAERTRRTSLLPYVRARLLQARGEIQPAIQNYAKYLKQVAGQEHLLYIYMRDARKQMRNLLMKNILSWKIERVLWLGQIKEDEETCLIACLPKEILKLIVQFLKEDLYTTTAALTIKNAF
mmetsp:Transcript_17542/g.24350  ORF Transcript_17542/g.24350 Transcript_17542/m.24350 type:complete len:318 (+) Transcript_17542:68-1021(+)